MSRVKDRSKRAYLSQDRGTWSTKDLIPATQLAALKRFTNALPGA